MENNLTKQRKRKKPDALSVCVDTLVIRPLYDADGITIYKGDALEILKSLPVEKVADATITDPPFFVRKDDWDTFEDDYDFEIFTSKWMRECNRRSDVIVSFFPERNLLNLLFAAKRLNIPYRRMMIWHKPPGSQYAGASKDGRWYDFEPILVFGEPEEAIIKANKFGVITERTITGQIHGCQKPETLLGDLIDSYVKPGGVVLDPFMGTGSTLVAAKRMGRRAIGIEREQKYIDFAIKRLAQRVIDFAGV